MNSTVRRKMSPRGKGKTNYYHVRYRKQTNGSGSLRDTGRGDELPGRPTLGLEFKGNKEKM